MGCSKPKLAILHSLFALACLQISHQSPAAQTLTTNLTSRNPLPRPILRGIAILAPPIHAETELARRLHYRICDLDLTTRVE
jgi:hypothetical protein